MKGRGNRTAGIARGRHQDRQRLGGTRRLQALAGISARNRAPKSLNAAVGP